MNEIEVRTFTKFCCVGLSGVFINMCLLWLLTDVMRLHYIISAAISIEASILSNFAMNDRWTFSDRETSGSIFIRIIKMNAIYISSSAANLSILVFLTEVFGIYYLASNLIGIGCATLFNFSFARKYVWGVHS